MKITDFVGGTWLHVEDLCFLNWYLTTIWRCALLNIDHNKSVHVLWIDYSSHFEGLLVLSNKKVNSIVLHLVIDYTNWNYADTSKILFSPRNILHILNFQQMGKVWHSFWSNNLLYKPHIPVVYKLYLNYQ